MGRMRRSLLGLLAIASVATSDGLVDAASDGSNDSPEDADATTIVFHDAAVGAMDEASAMLAAGGFAPEDRAIADLVAQLGDRFVTPYEWPSSPPLVTEDDDTDPRLSWVFRADERNSYLMDTLASREPLRLTTTVVSVLSPYMAIDVNHVVAGKPTTIDSAVYVAAIEQLLFRRGRAPDGNAPPHSVSEIADALRSYVDDGVLAPQDDITSGPTTDATAPNVSPTPTGSPTDTMVIGPEPQDDITSGPTTGATAPNVSPTPTDASTPERSFPLGLLVALAGASGFLIALVVRRRSATTPRHRPGPADLLDVGRDLIGGGTAGQIEIRAVKRAISLVDAEAGAFIRCAAIESELRYETTAGLISPTVPHDSLVARVRRAGHEMTVVGTDPMIGQRRALLAAPVALGGGEVGVLLLVRSPRRPFGGDALTLVADMAPLVAAALRSAAATEQVRSEAFTDGLTGLPNRRALDALLEAAEPSEPVVAIMIDIDHFKTFNDRHGHHAGDEVLRAVGRRIRDGIGECGTAHRYGGEEFVVVVRGTLELARSIAERVRCAVADTPVVSAEASYRVTVSLGVAIGTGAAAALRRADTALYEAKRSGRNRVVWAPDARVAAAAS